MNQLHEFIINHWQLWLAFVLILLAVLVNELISKKNKAKELSPQAVVSLINEENAVVMDIRDKESFNKGHIIDSINARTEDLEQAKIDKYKNKTIILVCARGLQAQTAAVKLRNRGFQTAVLHGGITSWQQADLPLVKNKG